MAERAKPAELLPDVDEIREWCDELREDEHALDFLKENGISEEMTTALNLGLFLDRLRVPVFQKVARVDDYDLVNVKRIKIHEEGSGRGNYGYHKRGLQVFSWPHIDLWDYDKPVVLVEDEINCAALMSIGENAMCSTGGIRFTDLAHFPIEKLRPAKTIIIALGNNPIGRSRAKTLSRAILVALPEVEVQLVTVPQDYRTLSLFLGKRSAEGWEQLVELSEEVTQPPPEVVDERPAIWEEDGQVWKQTRVGPRPVAPFIARIVEQGRSVIAGVESGRSWLIELTHHMGHSVRVRHEIGMRFREEVGESAPSEFYFSASEEELLDLIARQTGLDYATRHYGWVFGYLGEDTSAFYTKTHKITDKETEENADLEMKCPHPLIDFSLPAPDNSKTPECLNLALGPLIEMHLPVLTMPLLAVTLLSPVRRVLASEYDPYMVFIRGQTGCGKTTRAKAFQCFFGDFWDGTKLMTFKHTILKLMNLVGKAGDAAMLIDDLNYDKLLHGDENKVRMWFQGTPQGGGREGMTRDGKDSAPAPVERATKMVTCEILPGGDQSLIARSLILHVPHLDIWDKRWRVPHDEVKAKRALLPQLMVNWIRWVMANREMVKGRWAALETQAKADMEVLFERERGEGWGRQANLIRVFSRMVMLTTTFHLFTEFAINHGHPKARLETLRDHWNDCVLMQMLSDQVEALGEEGVMNAMVMHIEGRIAATRAAFTDYTTGNLAPSRCGPSSTTIGYLRPVEGRFAGRQEFADNAVMFRGVRVVVCFTAGVQDLWPCGETTWKRIKTYLEQADLVTYKRMGEGRFLLCQKDFAARIVSVILQAERYGAPAGDQAELEF